MDRSLSANSSEIQIPYQPVNRQSHEMFLLPRSSTHRLLNGRTVRQLVRKNLLVFLMLVALALGCVFGLAMRNVEPKLNKREIMYFEFLGELFLRLLKMSCIPLLIASLISGIGVIDVRTSRTIGLKAITYFALTSLSASILGIIVVMIINPGASSEEITESILPAVHETTTPDAMLDLIRNIFPENLIGACLVQYRTNLTHPQGYLENYTNKNRLEWEFEGVYDGDTNYLGLVSFSLFTGLIVSEIGYRSLPMLNFFIAVNIVIMKMVGMIIWLSPIGIFFLISVEIIKIKSFSALLGALGMYMVTVIVGLLIHTIIVLPVILFAFTRLNPFKFIYNVSEALMTAFSTMSSTATLPITLKCMEENNKVDPRVTRFVLPVGTIFNMDGTALTEAVAALFIAQFKVKDINFSKIVAVSLIATAASIAVSGTPHAGIFTMAMVFDAAGLPPSDISLIISVDWLLDRLQTVVNVLGDCIGAGIIHETSKDLLPAPVKIDSIEGN